jgi:hypothetical protein
MRWARFVIGQWSGLLQLQGYIASDDMSLGFNLVGRIFFLFFLGT